MKTSSAKAKGRGLQQKIRDMYREMGKRANLVDDDIESRGMGQNGVDLILSPAARRVFNHDIECKKHARCSVGPQFKEHFKKYKDRATLKLLFHEDNRSEALVTMRATDFFVMMTHLLNLEDLKPEEISGRM